MEIKQIDGAVIYTSGMNIDGDGGTDCYSPNGNGRDYLKNAGEDQNWFGIVTDNGQKDGNPIIQGPDDPCPGFYVSPTALADHSKKEADPRRYVDSSNVPYISVPRELKEYLGCLCVVFYKDMMVCGIVADVGPAHKYGEASICTAQRLGIPSSPKNGGVESGVTYLILTGTSKGWSEDIKNSLENDAQAAFEAFGGLPKIKEIMGWQ